MACPEPWGRQCGGAILFKELLLLRLWSFAARAQQRERMRSVGVLTPFSPHDSEGQNRVTAFVQAMQQLGWSVGQNIRLHLFGGKTSVRRQLVDDVGRLLAKVVRRLVWSGTEDETRPGIGAQ